MKRKNEIFFENKDSIKNRFSCQRLINYLVSQQLGPRYFSITQINIKRSVVPLEQTAKKIKANFEQKSTAKKQQEFQKLNGQEFFVNFSNFFRIVEEQKQSRPRQAKRQLFPRREMVRSKIKTFKF